MVGGETDDVVNGCLELARYATHRVRKLTRSELWSCVKVEVAVLGSLSLIVPVVSVDVKQH